MGYENVPPAHLRHLLGLAISKRKLKDDRAKELLSALTSKDPAEHERVTLFIESVLPGTGALMEWTWPFHGQRAVLLWLLPYLTGQTTRQALAHHTRDLASKATWLKKSRNETMKAQVRELYWDEDELLLRVWLTKMSYPEHEEVQQEVPRTEKVLVRIHFVHGMVPIAEVYASYQDARKSLFTTLDYLRGVNTPNTKGLQQQQILRPIMFTERDVEALATRLTWGAPCMVDGPDATGECGGVTFTGHGNGSSAGALDATVAKVKTQLDPAVKNRWRRYVAPVEHGDGFIEEPEVTFHFAEAQSRLQFNKKTSRVAIDFVVAELRDQLGV